MSDTATTDAPAQEGATATAPEESGGQQAQASPEPEQTQPLTKREARKAMHEDRARRQVEAAETVVAEPGETDTGDVPEPAVDEKGRRRDPKTGQFLPGEETEETADGDEAVGEQDTKPEAAEKQAPEQDTDADEAATEEAGTRRRVEIDPDHPIREMGLDAFTPSTEIEEQAIRALLNGTYNRRREVETLTSERDRLQARNRDLQSKLIELESTQTATEKWKQTPEYRQAVAKYEQIQEEIGPEAATKYWKGIQGELRELIESERTQRTAAMEAKEAEEAGRAWRDEALRRLETRLPEHILNIPDFGEWVEEEIQFLNDRLEAGRLPKIKTSEDAHQELARLITIRLAREPAVKAVYKEIQEQRREAEQEKASQAQQERRAADEKTEKAVDEFKKGVADKRRKTPPNPVAGMRGATGEHRAGGSEPEGPDLDAMSPAQLKKHMKKQARQDGRRRFGTSP